MGYLVLWSRPLARSHEKVPASTRVPHQGFASVSVPSAALFGCRLRGVLRAAMFGMQLLVLRALPRHRGRLVAQGDVPPARRGLHGAPGRHGRPSFLFAREVEEAHGDTAAPAVPPAPWENGCVDQPQGPPAAKRFPAALMIDWSHGVGRAEMRMRRRRFVNCFAVLVCVTAVRAAPPGCCS